MDEGGLHCSNSTCESRLQYCWQQTDGCHRRSESSFSERNGADLHARCVGAGIGVFDMTTSQWKDNYDANAEPYVTPEAGKSWYAANGQYPAKWDDAAVEGFFTQSGNSPNSSISTCDADIF